MPVKIVIPGPPASYQKAIMNWQAKDGRSGTHAYDKKGYRVWRDYARGRAAEICGGQSIIEGPVVVRIGAYFLPPQAMSQKKLRAASDGLLRPQVIDCDNLAKAVQDACLTGIIIRDDRQIVSLSVEKWFSSEPRVEIEITRWLGPPAATLFRDGAKDGN